MFAGYTFADNGAINTLGNGTPYATAVLADWVGMLTGAITNANQFSGYCNKANSFIQGAVGNWTVYDADAHASFAGEAKVLRRLCADGINYQYLWIGFHVAKASELQGAIGFMGGWNSTTKAPTTQLIMSNNVIIEAGVVVNATSMPMNLTATTSSWWPDNTKPFFNSVTNNALYPGTPISYTILSTDVVFAFWALPNNTTYSATLNSYQMGIMAEHDASNPWSTSEVGATPVVYGAQQQRSLSCPVRAPFMRNSVGNLVSPNYCGLSSLGSFASGGVATGSFASPTRYVFDKAIDASGNKTIPVLPIDVILKADSGSYLCYAGRMRGLFATLPTLTVGDTFKIGADTYVILPTGEWAETYALYSPLGKLCAKVA